MATKDPYRVINELKDYINHLEDCVVKQEKQISDEQIAYITGQEELIEYVRNSLCDMARTKDTTYSDLVVFLINLKPIKQ